MVAHWIEDIDDSPPHIIWRLMDKFGNEVVTLFVENIGDEDEDEYLLTDEDIEKRKLELERENL